MISNISIQKVKIILSELETLEKDYDLLVQCFYDEHDSLMGDFILQLLDYLSDRISDCKALLSKLIIKQ